MVKKLAFIFVLAAQSSFACENRQNFWTIINQKDEGIALYVQDRWPVIIRPGKEHTICSEVINIGQTVNGEFDWGFPHRSSEFPYTLCPNGQRLTVRNSGGTAHHCGW